jgi:Ca2+-binding EF-hand superfamily protein
MAAESHSMAEMMRESAPLFVNEVFDHDAVNKLIDTFFYEIDADRSGKLNLEEFQKAMHKIGVQDDLLIERNFKTWDLDSDGAIDFQEFITGLSTLHGEEDERLDMAFKVYDLDGNGKIDRDEMMTVLKRALKYSHPEFGASEVSAIILDLFRVAEVDPDDELDLDQFKRGVRSKKIVADCFRPTSSLLEVDTKARRDSIGKNPLWYKNF